MLDTLRSVEVNNGDSGFDGPHGQDQELGKQNPSVLQRHCREGNTVKVDMMTKRMVQSPTTGKMVEATVVEIEEIVDRPIVIKLSDGTVLRMRVDVVDVVRFEKEWDRDGHPLYNVRSGNIMAVLESPVNLKKKN